MSKDDQWDNENEAIHTLPHGVKLSWGYVKRQKRGPKGELNIKQIVDTAIEIADKDGLSALSMSRVAEALGFSTMSLYRYITAKEDLLILMQEAASDMAIPAEEEGENWRESMRQFVRSIMRVYREHPWFTDIPIMGVPMTPNQLRFVDWMLRSMRDFPLSDPEKMSVILLLSGYARSSGILQRDMDRIVGTSASHEAFSGLAYTSALKQLVTPERFPYLSGVVASGVYTGESVEDGGTIDDDFDFGLERILDGIAAYLDRQNCKS
ncbi:TetR/AcrR family transcriptional regulator [Paenibacillus harenae]|uniref:AcrR family transcriptional regulator n=1 Tax=Paenibacillus harenae TaxID=306543 RepID=A0ABT9U3D5_PAEHA|nr:TetR/AcrR family transcriptional regulator [Paenibacillus harenae]MDQ0114154.1 AcrR family transcriptional regulator [Paenibacillus harenae]